MHRKTAVLLVQLGTPEAPTADALRPYLEEFLSDQRVVDLPRWKWWPILHGVILRKRPARSAQLYAAIWGEDGLSPLMRTTRDQTDGLRQRLHASDPELIVTFAMRYGAPSIPDVLAELHDKGVERLLVVPLFPQYAGATNASVVDAIYHGLAARRYIPTVRMCDPFFDHPGYIRALAARVREASLRNAHWEDERSMLLMSFHGIPERHATEGDPYGDHCRKTARLLAKELELKEGAWKLVFQSRFGKEPWLTPATDTTLTKLPGQGVTRITILCPGFVADCLETLEEIAISGKETFMEAGGESFEYLPCLNDHEAWMHGLESIVRTELSGWIPSSQ
ncbi:MAG: ferrochelatase [Magnetococcales bacterium]|nr:ferrochelatase [Magnetococcales bacterium]